MQSDFIVRLAADYLVVPIVLVAGIAMLFVGKRDKYQVYSRAFLAGLVALFVSKVASLFYQGQRPFEASGAHPLASYLQNPGFPSDHVLFVFVLTFIVWASTKNKIVCTGLLAASAIVAVGRVVALVHTPVDVAGGIGCALIAAVLVYGRRFFSIK